MKKIEAVIPSSTCDAVTAALRTQGFEDVVASEVMGTGPVETRCYRGAAYVVDQHPCVKLELIAADEQVESAAEAILDAVQGAGGSKLAIAVSALEHVLAIGSPDDTPRRMPTAATVAARTPRRPLAASASHGA